MNRNQVILGRAFAFARIAPAAAFVLGNMVSPAFAASTIVADSCEMLDTIKNWLFGTVYVLGAIGLVLVAVSAFVGRFKWAHLISLGGGLFVVAMADALITFAAGNDAANRTACA